MLIYVFTLASTFRFVCSNQTVENEQEWRFLINDRLDIGSSYLNQVNRTFRTVKSEAKAMTYRKSRNLNHSAIPLDSQNLG